MKCALCKKKTSWDNSYGLSNFLICDSCYQKLKKITQENDLITLKFIFTCSIIKSEIAQEEKNDI